MREAAGHSPKLAGGVPPTISPPTPDSERVLLLECRLEKSSSALDEARADADRLRGLLAEAAAREADHARRYSLVHQELAEARADLAAVHERLSRSEALRAELEGHLFEAGAQGDAAELVRLRRELLSQRELSLVNAQTSSRLRARVDELLQSRETLLARVAEWQKLVRKEDPGAVDLGEFIAELRRDIMSLEHRNAASERQEVVLRERLARAGVDPGEPLDNAAGARKVVHRATQSDAQMDGHERRPVPVEPSAAHNNEGSLTVTPQGDTPLATTNAEEVAANSERRTSGALDSVASSWIRYTDSLDRGTLTTDSAEVPREPGATKPVTAPGSPPPVKPKPAQPVEGLEAADPAVRAAAYERLIRVHEGSPAQLADHLRSGLTDEDARVRRRAVLAAAAARLSLRPLLDPLLGDPDPQVRRVVREVLRHTSEKSAGVTAGAVETVMHSVE